MGNFYTNCLCLNNKILYRGYENGQRVQKSIEYQPSVFVPTNKKTKYKTLYGNCLDKMMPGSIKDTRDFTKEYAEVENFQIYGNLQFQYCYISDTFPEIIDYDLSQIVLANLDIETTSEFGFPNATTCLEEVTAITVKVKDTFYVFGCGDYNNTRQDLKYFRAKTETQLLEKFIDFWDHLKPDVITGWYVQFFDIPYLVARITKLLGDNAAKRLSPWRQFGTRRIPNFKGRSHEVTELCGISVLDYMELYLKFQPKQENDKLNYIAYVELGEKKLDYSEYGNLRNLYKENYQMFIDYNVKDVDLVDKLDAKLSLISMVMAIAFDAKVNFNDVFAQVRMWDSITFNHLRKKNIVVPPKKNNIKESYPGGYVKDPNPGEYRWIVSFDLDSLYPHIIAQNNISPETLIPNKVRNVVNYIKVPGLEENAEVPIIDCQDILNKNFNLSELKEQDYALAMNGCYFRRNEEGFFSEILMRMYSDRVEFKNKAKVAKKELVKVEEKLKETPDDVNLLKEKKRLKDEHTKYHNYQLAKKVQLNSAYGAMGNEFFRFFDVRLASAVTVSGQVIIQWIAKAINTYLNSLLKTENYDYVVAIDTDSVYITLDKLVQTVYKDKNPERDKIVTFLDKVCDDKIQKVINQSVTEFAEYTNAFKQKMKMKRESICNKAIWTVKKRYMLNVLDNEDRIRFQEPELKLQGVEAVKSSTPELCRENLKKSIGIIMNGTQEELQKFVEEFKTNFIKSSYVDIAEPKQCNNLDKYHDSVKIYGTKCPQHVRGALIYNHLLKEMKLTKKYPLIQEGDKIKIVKLMEPNPAQSDVISFTEVLPEEFNIKPRVDYQAQFEKIFLSPLSSILDAIGWKAEQESSLDALF